MGTCPECGMPNDGVTPFCPLCAEDLDEYRESRIDDDDFVDDISLQYIHRKYVTERKIKSFFIGAIVLFLLWCFLDAMVA